MPPAIDTVSFTVTAAAVAGSAMAAVAGDSASLRQCNTPPGGVAASLLNAWCDTDSNGWVQVTSPKLTDATRGLRFRTSTHAVSPFLLRNSLQPLYPVDVLSPTLSSVAGAGKIDNLTLLVYYYDLLGSAARFVDPGTVDKNSKEVMTVETILTPASGSTYANAQALNAQSDLGKAGSDYALIGYVASSAASGTTITWRGADSGNYRVSGPCTVGNSEYTASWFYDLSDYNSLPMIPVFNYNNKAGIFIELLSNDLLTVVNVTSIFARLT